MEVKYHPGRRRVCLSLRPTSRPASFDLPDSFSHEIRQSGDDSKFTTGTFFVWFLIFFFFVSRTATTRFVRVKLRVSTECLGSLIITFPDSLFLCPVHVRVVIILNAHVIRARGLTRRRRRWRLYRDDSSLGYSGRVP